MSAPATDAERHLEFARWKLSAEWAVPLVLVTGDSVAEMRAAVAALRPEFLVLPSSSSAGEV